MRAHLPKIFALSLAALIFFGLIPFQPEGLSFEGWLSIRCLLTMALLWMTEALPLAGTALIPLIIFPLYLKESESIFSAYAHPLIFLFLGGFVLGGSLEYSKAHQWIAYRINKIFARSKTPLLGLMISAAFLSMWISNTAATLMFIPIVLSLTAGHSKKYIKTMIFGVMYGCSIGGFMTLIGTPPNAVYAALMKDFAGVSVGFLDWMKIGMPISLTLLTLIYFYLRRNLSDPEPLNYPSQSLNPTSKKVLLVFVLTALAWIFQVFPTHVTAIGAALVLMTLNVFDQNVLGKNPFRSVPLSILILFGGGIALSRAIMTTDAGTWLATALFGNMSPGIVSRFIGVSFATILSEFGSNTASANLLGPLAISAAQTSALPVSHFLLPVILGANLGFMLPIATPPNAIAYATGKITIREMIKVGLFVDLVGILTVVLFMQIYIWLGWV